MSNFDGAFESIMEKVGYSGHFQTRYKFIYITLLTFLGALLYLNLILALNVPEYWCHVPGIEKTNFTITEWRMITLPKQNDSKGINTYSTCKMYNQNFTTVEYWDYEKWNYSNFDVSDCVHGFEYSKEWYDRTIVSQENWVCEKDLYVTNTFVVSRIGEVIGTFIFGQLGDTLGRKLIFYVSIFFVVVGRVASIITTFSFTWFIIFTIMSTITVSSLFQSPLIVAMEISREDERSNIAMAQNIGWSCGTCFMPLLLWLLRDAIPFMWLTSLLPLALLFFHKYMIESPRWLISRKRLKEALEQFKIIAKFNRTDFHLTEKDLNEIYSGYKIEKVYGIMSLFQGWRIARNTLIMGFSWCVVSVSYFTLMLSSSHMGKNPFLNFFLQSVVEIPAYIVGKYFADKIGRRLTNSLFYFGLTAICIPIIIVVKDPNYEIIVLLLATLIKFINGITFYAASLQAMELYPTCLRQTGISLGAIWANAVGVIAPYMVYLGTNYDVRYPYIAMLILFNLGGLFTLFLPETLHERLPDSLEEALRFGENQKFWSFPKPPKISTSENDPEKVKMNQEKFQP